MQAVERTNAEQTALWNGVAGRAWVDTQRSLDRLFQPFEDLLVEQVVERGAQRVLDIGCGTGSTTLAIARRVGANGRVVGVDISEPMIALARERATLETTAPQFVCGDAQTYAFVPASFDLIVSRFGVMFFADPVGAFANLRAAAAPSAALHVIAWRSAQNNPFMTTAERAAAPFLPQIQPRRSDEPGQFAFADRARVQSILERSGWLGIRIEPIDVECVLPLEELGTYVTRLGPLGQVLQQADGPTRARVLETVRAAFEPYVHGDEVRFTAACWTIEARAAQ
jgi:SAM-dependent methyltransferase